MQHRQPLAFLTALVLVAMAATLVSSGDVAIVPLDISFITFRDQYVPMVAVPLALGTPWREYRMTLDLGIDFVWVFSSECTQPRNCAKAHATYNPLLSSSSHSSNTTLSFKYAGGQLLVTGTVQEDLAKLRTFSHSLPFLLASSLQEPFYFPETDFDGPFGLAYPNTLNGSLNIIERLYHSGSIPARQFSIHMNNSVGALHLGGTLASAHLSPFAYVPLITSDWTPERSGYYLWAGVVDDVLVEGVSTGYCTTNQCAFFVDTAAGVTNLGNTAPAPTINADCSNIASLPTFTFVINGFKLPLTPKNYVVAHGTASGADECLAGITSMAFKYPIIFGGSWFSAYYTTFDITNKRIGFAVAAPLP